jgi:Flp pilus assembly protein TadG
MLASLRKIRNMACRRFCSLPKETAGAEIAEAAVVLPLLFLLLFAIIWFARAFNIYSTVTTAAREGARFAAHPSCATCAVTGWNGTNLPTNAAVATAVTNVLYNSHIDPTPIQTYTPPFLQAPTLQFCTSPPAPPGTCSVTAGNITVCRFVLLNPGAPAAEPKQCGTAVSFQYPFGAYFPFPSYPVFTFRAVLISAEGQSEMQY